MDGLVADMETIRAGEGTGPEQLEAVVHTLLQKIAEQQAAVTVVLHERRSVPPEAATKLQAKRDRVDAIIDEILQQGFDEARSARLPLRLTRLAITGMTNWAYTWFDPNGSLRVEEIAKGFVDLLRHGVEGPAAS